jgi:hypothetical protein
MLLRCLTVLAASMALSSLARAQTYPDCEKYDEPLAYNQCLASHGPSALHALAATSEEGVAAEVHGIQGVQRARPFHRAHGRMSATFDIANSRTVHRH